jgi:hypothetical protein
MSHQDSANEPVFSLARPSKRRGRVDLQLVVYLPEAYGGNLAYSVNRSGWIAFPEALDGFHRIWIRDLKPHTEIMCRYRDGNSQLRPIAPLGILENLNGRYFVPDLPPGAQHISRRTGHARICLESTLEGLIADYCHGLYAPSELQDLLTETVAARMLSSRLPEHMASLEIDEIMAPVFPSVADRSHLDPKFNYLVYGVGDVDWQLGTPAEFQKLVDTFHEYGIGLVPDMIFAHFVKNPHLGGLDSIINTADGKSLFVDEGAYHFRDYGTWMFDFANPDIRRIVAEGIAEFVRLHNLSAIRIDFVDGIIFQYSKREENHGVQLLRELSAAIRKASPGLTVIGEAFSTANEPIVQELIDVAYCPRGFPVVEQVYKSPAQLPRPFFPDVAAMAKAIRGWTYGERREAVYGQLHDEAWRDEHIEQGRPDVPWAYGAQPAQLALNCGRQLVESGELRRRDLLDFVRRRVRGAEALTMFLSNLRYVYLPSVDSLALGRLDEPRRWIVSWEDPTPDDMRLWIETGLPEKEIFQFHDQHRLDMKSLRAVYRSTTPIDEENHRPLTSIELFHSDPQASVLGVLRRDIRNPQSAVVVLFNFGPLRFTAGMSYQLPLPPDLKGGWEVLFDGDNVSEENLAPGMSGHGLPVGTKLTTGGADYAAGDHFLRMPLGANSLIVLRHA